MSLLQTKGGKEVATMKKKPRKSVSRTPMTFKQLLGRVQSHEAVGSLIKTAVQTGWLTDENFLTRLTEKEHEQIREIYQANPSYRRTKLSTVESALPGTVGPMVEESDVHPAGDRIRITGKDTVIYVDARLYLTMRKRHPRAALYLPDREDTRRCVYFSDRSTVAVLPELPDA